MTITGSHLRDPIRMFRPIYGCALTLLSVLLRFCAALLPIWLCFMYLVSTLICRKVIIMLKLCVMQINSTYQGHHFLVL